MAHKDHVTQIDDPGGVGLPPALRTGLAAAIVVGALLWFAALLVHKGPEGGPNVGWLRMWESYLLAYMYFLMLGLGGVVFTAIQYCASARWSIAVRRIAEGMGAFIPVSFLLFLVLMLGWNTLYGLESPYRHAIGRGGQHIYDPIKSAYLHWGAVLLKGVVFYGLWFYLAQRIRNNSLKQDQTRDASLFQQNRKLSIVFLIVFAYTFSLHAIDMLQALEPKWFSTMFGVYCFSGLLLTTFCTITLVALAMRRRPAVGRVIRTRHLYDLGTWIMAFSCFMMYIGFSQYMLIWYANLPEESFYMVLRTEGGWQYVFSVLPVLKWLIPFAVLMPQGFRANPRVLVFVCVCVLAGQWLDLYWIIYPVFSASPVMPGLPELGAFVAFAAVFGLSLDRVYARHSVLPIGDPYLPMSVSGSYL